MRLLSPLRRRGVIERHAPITPLSKPPIPSHARGAGLHPGPALSQRQAAALALTELPAITRGRPVQGGHTTDRLALLHAHAHLLSAADTRQRIHDYGPGRKSHERA